MIPLSYICAFLPHFIVRFRRSFKFLKINQNSFTWRSVRFAVSNKSRGSITLSLKQTARDPILIFPRAFSIHFHTTCRFAKWKTSKIVSLFKDGDRRDPGNYRGIALQSYKRKLFTTLLNNRITQHLETEGKELLCTAQNGFRSTGNRSCQDHLYTLTETLKNRRAIGANTYGFYMDLSKAFDMANKKLLEIKLRKKGIKGKVLNAIKTLSGDMRAVASANEKISCEFNIERGTAQGCPLSPTLFDIYIDDLVHDLNKCQHGIQHTPVLAYADDILVMADTPEKLQEMVNMCHEWTCKWRMKANTIKSQTMQWLPNHDPNTPRPDCNMKFGKSEPRDLSITTTLSRLTRERERVGENLLTR